ncbi:uncharacterized protein EAF01_004245 [Botrytis porri]|uniref:uncharacterized protein n=1 Tax=Botrytis porri TaxID=87229 RepID=UPI001900EF33|nr:uncharacterized protein EAF01_004245 [Botrytis porri]KAF7908490.1 hypothetical protein EAF01_004245 [Botrytis porri]
MHFSKAVITAILAFTSVQGLPTQKRCDTCGVSSKESKIEKRASHESPYRKARLRPIGDFCDKCPPKEFFEAGGAGHGMTPHGMMGEFVTGMCNDHCGTGYPDTYPVLQPRVTISSSESNPTQPEVVTSPSESTTTQPETTPSQPASQEYPEIKSDDHKNDNYTIQFEADDIIEFKPETKGTCTTEGKFNCISGTSFQQCGSGTWSTVQNMAPGTVCLAGYGYDLNTAAVEKRMATTQDIQNFTSEELVTKAEKQPAEKRLWIQVFKWEFFGPKPPVHLTPAEQEEKEKAAEAKYAKEFHQYGGHGDLKKEAEEKKAADEKHAKEFHQFGGVNKEDEKKKAKEEEKEALAWKQFGPKEDGEKQE